MADTLRRVLPALPAGCDQKTAFWKAFNPKGTSKSTAKPASGGRRQGFLL